MAADVKVKIASSAPTVSGGNWITEAEKYLEAAGWERDGIDDRGMSMWRDYVGTNKPGERLPVLKIKTPQGNEETIYQYHGHPIPWSYPIEQAMSHQRERDRLEPKKQVG